MTSWSILCFQESLRSVNHGQLPCKWHRTASIKSCWKSSPAKIFHRNSSVERRLKFIAIGKEDDNKKPLSTAKATSSTQRPQHVQRQRQSTTITLQMKLMTKGNTDCRRFKKRWGDQATLEVYSQNYLLRCNGRQQQLHDLYNARQKYFSNVRTEDSRHPLHHEQQCFFIVISFISLKGTVHNIDKVWHVGRRYICK